MITYASTVEIARTPSVVLAALLDTDSYSQWTEMVDNRYETPGEPRVGSRGTYRLPSGPLAGTFRYEITELVPDRAVTFRIEHPALDWTAVSRLEPTGGGTRLVYSGEIRMRGWRRLLEPFMTGEVRRGEQKEVERLKALLEATPPAT